MSLINVKNLVAPFQNKVHLVGILLVVVLFTTFRLAGGSVKVEGREANGRRAASSPLPQSDSLQHRPEQPVGIRSTANESRGLGTESADLKSVIASGTGKTAPVESRKSVDEMLNDDSATQAKIAAEKAKAAAQPKQDSGFDDIERQLGLR